VRLRTKSSTRQRFHSAHRFRQCSSYATLLTAIVSKR
jgi:hypothetical protein